METDKFTIMLKCQNLSEKKNQNYFCVVAPYVD